MCVARSLIALLETEDELAGIRRPARTWRLRVLGNPLARPRESIPGLQSRRTLKPGLTEDLRQLRFSSDGRYVLEQDDAGITVLTVEAFAVAFRAAAVAPAGVH